jgi:hypothetical protein
MQQNVRAALVGNHEPIALGRVEPLHQPLYLLQAAEIFCHLMFPHIFYILTLIRCAILTLEFKLKSLEIVTNSLLTHG